MQTVNYAAIMFLDYIVTNTSAQAQGLLMKPTSEAVGSIVAGAGKAK